MSDFAPRGFESAGYLDAAETFAESDVTLQHTDTETENESVGLGTNAATTSRTADDTTFNTSQPGGLVINPNYDGVTEINADLSANTGLLDNPVAYVAKSSDGTILAQTPFSGGSFTISGFYLAAGTDYRVYIDDGGDTWDRGYYNADGFPYTGDAVDIVRGYTGSETTAQVPAINNVTASYELTSGSVTVEWPQPSDVYRWDSVLFQRSTDGETVEVYIEESTDGGSTWTTIAGPVARGQEITADPQSEVRLRVDLARSSKSNNPTLDAVYRRFVV